MVQVIQSFVKILNLQTKIISKRCKIVVFCQKLTSFFYAKLIISATIFCNLLFALFNNLTLVPNMFLQSVFELVMKNILL